MSQPESSIAPAAWDDVVRLLLGARSVLLLGHVAPDGDALGSALAVGLALRSLPGERRVAVSFGDEPFAVPANLSWLPGLDLVRPPSATDPSPDVVATFDASSMDRLGCLGPVADAAPALVVVDHHTSYDGFGTHPLVDRAAPATAVLADELIRRLGAPLTPDVAANLYAGLVTDTGSFRFAGTTSDTLQLAARLLDTGIRFDVMSRRLFDDAPFTYLGLLGRALDRTVLEAPAAGGLGLVWTVVPASDRQRAGLAIDLAEPVIDAVRKAEEAEVACVVKEDDNGRLRVSLRSKGRVDVSAVAATLGGGGHRYAAGFTAVSADVAEVLSAVRHGLSQAPHLEA
ncbi:MAG: bifunctional oligoribonuclease/PAP phosphatase NrnA [Actinomycetota bacterium]|nr:bifunctional oligoribonuclease/PAP phosphatase NrnA [Actinomycetota bacterium]MDH5279109.1 bifunctional oligoribonuclease/PAP phosphatase NrnA [Actinomycetota bacterium]